MLDALCVDLVDQASEVILPADRVLQLLLVLDYDLVLGEVVRQIGLDIFHEPIILLLETACWRLNSAESLAL